MIAGPASYQQLTITSPTGCSQQRGSRPWPKLAVSEGLTSGTFSGADLVIQFPNRSSLIHEYGSNSTLKLLLTSDVLVGKRIPVDELAFTKELSKGSSGEANNSQPSVCSKPKKHTADDVQEFAEEIELSTRLKHLNISKSVGVSWTSLNNLAMLAEYFPLGDLQRYLQKHGDLLSIKSTWQIGVALAVGYLHGLARPIIHRDLKSRNVLFTQQLEAKLIDFGVGRGCLNNTMTADVGTPYWTAPELLEGK